MTSYGHFPILVTAMRRKPSSFDAFTRELDAEVRARGPEAEALSEALDAHFRLAAQVIARRHELGLTQKQLAAAAGIHQSEISDIERGASTPSYRTLARVARGLHAAIALVPLKKRAGAAGRPRRRSAVVHRPARVAASARSVSARRR